MNNIWNEPWIWALAGAAVGLGLTIPAVSPRVRIAGWLICAVSTAILIAALAVQAPVSRSVATQIVFWSLAALTLASAAAAISMRSAVYCAIWFALSLLGTAGLMLLQGALFLGVATVIVYAGAIVVTFLFVIMLAQPEGHAVYDRISWGWYVKPMAIAAAAVIAGVMSYGALTIAEDRHTVAAEQLQEEVLHAEHVAKVGIELFGRHLIAVQVAGVLLLVSLVGAIAMVAQGKARQQAQREDRRHG